MKVHAYMQFNAKIICVLTYILFFTIKTVGSTTKGRQTEKKKQIVLLKFLNYKI